MAASTTCPISTEVVTAPTPPGTGVGFAPCTPAACMEILAHYGIDCTGKKAVVIGRSLVVGKPLGIMLMGKNATVTTCHTRTKDVPAVTKEADILVSAAGVLKSLTKEYVRPGQIVIDVSINWDEAKGGIAGDAVYEEVEPIVEAITPVPGGVGAVTTSVLIGLERSVMPSTSFRGSSRLQISSWSALRCLGRGRKSRTPWILSLALISDFREREDIFTMAKQLLGKEVNAALNARIIADCEAVKAKGVNPTLAIVRCGVDEHVEGRGLKGGLDAHRAAARVADRQTAALFGKDLDSTRPSTPGSSPTARR